MLLDKKEVTIEMLDNKGEYGEKKFVLKRNGITPFYFSNKAQEIDVNSGAVPIHADMNFAVEFFPTVIGIDKFMVDGIDPALPARNILSEFFVNDPGALSLLAREVGFFLNPASEMRYKKQSGLQN